jgi:tRNA pseudouridine55 synthase
MLSPQDFLEGQVLLIDKPLRWTSFDVVNKLRFALRKYTQEKKIKVGHAGTLDPLATGLLIICTGKMTKQIDSFQAQEKEYEGQIVLGATTPSYDLETAPENFRDCSHLQPTDVERVLTGLQGEQMQTPPMYSAVQVDGKRAYRAAREGQTIELKQRLVTISRFEATQIALPEIDFRVVCSKGTYIRSLAHQVGEDLGVGAYLSALRRTRIGDFSITEALSIEAFLTQYGL